VAAIDAATESIEWTVAIATEAAASSDEGAGNAILAELKQAMMIANRWHYYRAE
jgi:hypothetical protein